MEGCGFRDQIQEFEARNAVVLGVSFDSVEDNRAFAEKFSFPYDLLCDVDRSLGLAYGACDDAAAAYPSRITCVIDEAGVVTRVYDKVQPKTHVAEVLAEL